MIGLGLLCMLVGGGFLLAGNSMNNDMSTQLESIFNNGVANPGDGCQITGIILLIVGALVLLAGISKRFNPDDEETVTNHQEETSKKADEVKCDACGAMNLPHSRFCSSCGEPIKEKLPISCVQCGTELPHGSKFCLECGAKQQDKTLPLVCSSCGTPLPEKGKFCPGCGGQIQR